ncbi:MAG: tRNA preQ1(34) S-adenosylmethionine ribosyltransferase-isomerase QueA [Fimbriimonadaceae bacterium]|nr:tRNA preQ1(34) S-adenosylmethionine ribosyltransferase-isomerase QueA [Fimbriimonadaceae bacterium]
MDRLSDYDYDLPVELIAQEALPDRSASRLLHIDKRTGAIKHRQFREVVDILQPDDLLVVNNTRVTALRLFGKKQTGGQVELLLLREHPDGGYEALSKPAKRLKPGALVELEGALIARIEHDLGEGKKRISFPEEDDPAHKLREIGEVPLPPYIHTKLKDAGRYQTVYAEVGGSAAAPTAGLHFTPQILNELQEKGVQTSEVTLDVGLDTFRPVSVERIEDHKMHGERCSMSAQTACAIAQCKGRVIAVGTTSVRTIETFANSRRDITNGVLDTSIFIYPGYCFKAVEGMFTNFHMPRTTMLMMISAMVGREAVMNAYKEAVSEQYRFLSFGDSMLIL